jgi:hypothetical protein
MAISAVAMVMADEQRRISSGFDEQSESIHDLDHRARTVFVLCLVRWGLCLWVDFYLQYVCHSLLKLFPMDRPNRKSASGLRLCLPLVSCFLASALVSVTAAVADALPNGTWFSKPQIMFHLSNGTLGPVMERVRAQRYRVVFLDFRNVSLRGSSRLNFALYLYSSL